MPLPPAAPAYVVPDAVNVPTRGLPAGTVSMYVAHAVPPGHPNPGTRSVATFTVDSANTGMVTWIGVPPAGVTGCRALRAMSAPVALPSVVTCPVMTPGDEVLPPSTSGIVPMAVPTGTLKVMVGLYITAPLVL